MDDTTLTPPRLLTFSERTRMTWTLRYLGWRMLAASLPVVWSSGATVSSSPIGRLPALLEASRDGDVTLQKRRGNAPETETETELLGPKGPCASSDAPPAANDDALKPDDVVEAWNDAAERCGLSKVVRLTDARRKRLRTMIAQHPPDDFARALDALERSPFCRGERTDWKADFDFFLQAKSFTKLLEGAYG
jgi:hypothetical protein